MKRDTIFRVASITKPITAVAAMILVEECKLRLDESIETWLPELANRRVLKSISSQLDDTVPALRAITLRDLFTYRMGFGSVMAMPDRCPIQKLIREYRIGGDHPMLPSQSPATEQWLQKLGSLPWMAHPGERWMYHVSGDVLGVLIARVCGQSLGMFMRERIFDPLGMKDTAFHASRKNRVRVGRRLWHLGVHRPRRASDRHPLHAAPDGFAGPAETIQRLLDTGLRSTAIGSEVFQT
jgi:CubicO group peptidase (beta-lactamase class C family)